MNNFKVGDKIAFYASRRLIGVIERIDEDDMITVKLKSSSAICAFLHPKQCRKLVKKKKFSDLRSKMSTEAQIKSTKKAMEGHQEKPMTFDPTKPAQTESGEKARIICSNMKGNYPIVAVIERIDGSEYLAKFTKEGLSFQTIYIGNMVSDNLINIPEPKSIDVHVGGVYKARNGDVGICFQKEEDGLHRTYLLARKDWCWTQGYGKFLSWGDHELDLIEHLGDIQNIHEHIKEKMK